MKVKVFTDSGGIGDFEEKINDWLRESGRISILERQLTATKDVAILVIWYRDNNQK